ncbi:MAG TPA: hypothetical protein H9979_03010 [Candidatus Megamonas gallistercoris]|nr:hypothetical protein [Candidatus Megamonas gallistercoris]
MEKRNNNDNVKIKVPWYGYVVFVLAILLFSGVFSSSDGILRALDFNVLNGSFGQIPTDKAMSFRGAGGSGAKDGFLFALELIPAVILALGIVNVIDGLGGLKAAQKIMNPLLKPLLGVPGISALANIANMQSTDAAAGMVKELKDNNLITDKERSIIIAYQTSGSAFITNYFSSGAAAFSILMAPIIVPIFVIFIFKIVGANLMRLYFKIFS